MISVSMLGFKNSQLSITTSMWLDEVSMFHLSIGQQSKMRPLNYKRKTLMMNTQTGSLKLRKKKIQPPFQILRLMQQFVNAFDKLALVLLIYKNPGLIPKNLKGGIFDEPQICLMFVLRITFQGIVSQQITKNQYRICRKI